MENAMNTIKKYLPYAIIFAFSLFASHLVFYSGVNIGDDFYFHMPNIYDRYLTVIDGKGFSPISGNLASGLGSGTEIMYSPLSHFVILIWALIVHPFGGSFIFAYKTMITFSVFLSGIFMYRFAMHFTKNARTASLIAASVYIFYPYRLFDLFCRVALGESFAFVFLPLFFMGLYDIVSFDKEITVIPFIEVILGGSLLYLSHNITALFAYVIGMVYLLSCVPKIIKLLKKKKYVIYAGVSVILLIGITSIALFSQLELISTGIYNVSDSVKMWTDAEEVSTRVLEEWKYSGFLNVSYLKGKKINESYLLTGVLMYLISCFVFAVADKIFERVEILREYHLHLVPSFAVLFVMISLISVRLESYLSVIIFFVIYAFYHILESRKTNEKKDDIYKNPLLWLSIVVIVVSLVFMQDDDVWLKMPNIFLNIQFPWRLWTFVQLFLSILVGLFAYHYADSKKAIIILAVFAGFLMITNEPTIEKRIFRKQEIRWVDGVTVEDFDRGVPLGFNKEYTPRVFFDKEYKSEYAKSLYRRVKGRIGGTFYDYEDYSLKPVILDGKGDISVDYAFAPTYEMQVSLKENSLIQIPLIYYPGYEITVISDGTEAPRKLKGENVDGLLSFSLDKGEYTVKTEYVGTPLRTASKIITVISLVAVGVGIIYGVLIENKKYLIFVKKRDTNEKA